MRRRRLGFEARTKREMVGERGASDERSEGRGSGEVATATRRKQVRAMRRRIYCCLDGLRQP